MKIYPARFVGEFATRAEGWDSVVNVGDVALVHGYPDGRDRAYIRCACGDIDVIPVSGERTWQLTSRDPVNLEPSVHVKAITTCHYFVHGGQLQMLDDTTTPLKELE